MGTKHSKDKACPTDISVFLPQIVGDDHLPEIIKPRAPKRASEEEKKEFAALFDSGTDDEEEEDMTDR